MSSAVKHSLSSNCQACPSQPECLHSLFDPNAPSAAWSVKVTTRKWSMWPKRQMTLCCLRQGIRKRKVRGSMVVVKLGDYRVRSESASTLFKSVLAERTLTTPRNALSQSFVRSEQSSPAESTINAQRAAGIRLLSRRPRVCQCRVI